MKTLFSFIISSFVIFTLSVYAADIKIPKKLPQLTVTEQAYLGTREDNIGLPPGTTVTAFKIKDHMGKSTSLKQLKNKGKLLIIFYRGGWCPYCNRQIHQLTQAWPEFNKRGVTPVLISADKPDAAALALRTYEIPFPVLSDPDLIAHDIFKVTMTLDKSLVSKYKEYGIILEDWNGKGHQKFAVSSAFIVSDQGVVEWSHSSKDYKKRPSVQQFLQVIDERKKSQVKK